MLFDYQSNKAGTVPGARTGGWTESWYRTGTFSDDTRTKFLALCLVRARMLSTGARIVGQRYQQVDPIGASSTGANVFPGASGLLADVPQASLLFRVQSTGQPNHKNWIARGIPDARIVEGEYVPATQFTIAIESFFNTLVDFNFRAQDLAAATAGIFSIASNGDFVLTENFTFPANNIVQVMRTMTDEGNFVSGTFLTTHDSPTTGNIVGWNRGACTGGRFRQRVIIYPQCSSEVPSAFRVIVRKVGRPFVGYRGKASRRR
jgi:hypothetical protein